MHILILLAALVLAMPGLGWACALSWDTNAEPDMDHYEVIVEQMGVPVFSDIAVPHDAAQARTGVPLVLDPTVFVDSRGCPDPAWYRAWAVDAGGLKSVPGELQLNSPPSAPDGVGVGP